MVTLNLDAVFNELLRRVREIVREEVRAALATPSSASTATETYLDDVALAKMLYMSRETVQQWRQRGEGPPYVKMGSRCVRYRLSDVQAWMKKRERGV